MMETQGLTIERDLSHETAESRLLAATPYSLRPMVRKLLATPHCGGRGLRAWVALMETLDRPLPSLLPDELIETYLKDDDAEPFHDCEDCGLPVPVRVGRRVGSEPVAERAYFPICPNCSGRTGRFAFWSKPSAASRPAEVPDLSGKFANPFRSTRASSSFLSRFRRKIVERGPALAAPGRPAVSSRR